VRRWWHSAALVGALVVGRPCGGQQPQWGVTPLSSARAEDLTAGSATEKLALLATSLSQTPATTHTSIRPFTREERTKLSALVPLTHTSEWRRFAVSEPSAFVWMNTASANPDRDGVVWQGRGVTAAITGGFGYELGVMSLAVNPIVFYTQNLGYDPASPIAVSQTDFRNPFFGDFIDTPYRFGARAYSRWDPGESFLRIDLKSIGFGFSTAAQSWGPADRYPLLMGTGAGGYPRLFIETAPIHARIASVKAHYSVGRLESSGFEAPKYQGFRSRLAPALVVSVVPAGFQTLELGGARLFHVRWSADELTASTAMLPFKGLLKQSSSTGENIGVRDLNQTASVFARLAPRGSGVEFFGELYREDHNVNIRDLIGEPDHESAYTLGFRRAWGSVSTRIRALEIEFANGRKSHLQRVREQGPVHLHYLLTEGHTLRGQPFASDVIPGGGGISVTYSTVGIARSITWHGGVEHTAQNIEGGTWDGKNTGNYRLEAILIERRRRATLSWRVGVRQGFGLERATNLTLAASVRRN